MLRFPSKSKILKLLFIFGINFVFIVGAILANYLGLVGGRYFLLIAVFVGIFNCIYTMIFLLKKEHRHYRIDDFCKPDVFKPFKKKQMKIFIYQILVMVFGILLIPMYVVVGNYLILDKDAEIQSVVDNLIDESMNETEKVDALLSWFNRRDNAPENFSSMYHRSINKKILLHFLGMLYIYDEEPNFCFRLEENLHWVIVSRGGMCGEQAILFTEFGRIAGLNVSTVRCIPEDHAWNEVYVDDRKEPLVIDATKVKLPESNGHVSSEFMANKVAGDWRKIGEYPSEGNVSFIYCEFPNDSDNYNITQRYTDVINITVNVTNPDDEPLSDVMVKVISYNRPNVLRRSCWGLVKKTNDTGQCTFTIGGGRYKFELQLDGDLFSIDTDIEYFWEGENQQYLPVTYSSKTIIDVFIENPIYIIIVALLCLLVINRYIEKKRPPKFKK